LSVELSEVSEVEDDPSAAEDDPFAAEDDSPVGNVLDSSKCAAEG
jgi:hypothetical protein